MSHELSKNILDSAYKEYRRLNANPLPRDVWEKHITGEKKYRMPKTKRTPKKPSKPAFVRQKSWVEIQKEYLRWRKTDEFQKWRHKQFLKQGGTCYYCDQPLGGTRQNVEHVMPKSKGGDNRKSNLVLACSKCNQEKNTTVLNRKTREALKVKNKAKKGTYTQLKEKYESEYDLAVRLRNMFKD